jgi:hypothetical protein
MASIFSPQPLVLFEQLFISGNAFLKSEVAHFLLLLEVFNDLNPHRSFG